MTWTTCGSSTLLRQWLFFSLAWWTMQLISGKKEWKVVLTTYSDIACLTFKLPLNATGSFHSHQCHTTQLAFSESPVFELWRDNIPSIRRMSSEFHKVVWSHFSGVMGKFIITVTVRFIPR